MGENLNLEHANARNIPTCTWEVLVIVRVALRSGHPGLWIITVKHPNCSG